MEKPLKIRFFDAVIFFLTIVILVITAANIQTHIHEFAGHGLVSICFGGEIEAVALMPFGGGYIDAPLPKDASRSAQVSMGLGGILTGFIMAALMLIANALSTNRFIKLSTLVYAATVTWHSGAYLLFGTIFGSGDPGIVLAYYYELYWPMIIFSIIILISASILISRRLFILGMHYFKLSTFRGRYWFLLWALAGPFLGVFILNLSIHSFSPILIAIKMFFTNVFIDHTFLALTSLGTIGVQFLLLSFFIKPPKPDYPGERVPVRWLLVAAGIAAPFVTSSFLWLRYGIEF